MISIKAILDNKKLILLEKIDINFPQEVIITFLDKNSSEIEFWNKDEIGKMGQLY